MFVDNDILYILLLPIKKKLLSMALDFHISYIISSPKK